MAIKQFIEAQRITMTAARADENPNMPDSHDMDHWKCILRRPGHRMTVYFSMGYGHKGAAPDVANVLDCLASDSAGMEYTGFNEWCSDLGYDSDSRKAEKIYKQCERQAVKLRAFLGDEPYEALLYQTDRE